MDGMRNRQHTRGMPNWMTENDAMADLASRMTPPNWPLGRRAGGGPWRERRGSGGSAMSATSEDDSSYDAAGYDKSSQGSGGSGGLDAVTHEIPIMIEAEMPPSMMPQAAQPPPNNTNPQQDSVDAPKKISLDSASHPPFLHPEASADQQRSGRCASAPPQVVEKPLGPPEAAPQKRSATVPIHNNVAKPFDPSYGSASPGKQDPIIEETPQQSQQVHSQQHPPPPPQQQQQVPPQQQQHNDQYPQQQQYDPQQQYYQHQHPQGQYPDQYQQYPGHEQQYYQQPFKQPGFAPRQFYPGRNPEPGFYQQPLPQQHAYNNEYEPQPNFYPEVPVGFEDINQQVHPQKNQQPKHSGVIRNIPIFIEGQSDPIINEDRPASLSSSPRQQPTMRPQVPQRGGNQQPNERMNFQQPQQYYQQPQPQQYYQQPQPQQYYQQQPQQYYQQQQQPQPPRRAQEVPLKEQPQQPRKGQDIPIKVKQTNTPCQTPPRQPSPAPPPVKLTPFQKIDQVRANSEEYFKRVDEFKGTSKTDRDYLYLDEMLTRAMISLDDIDPDGNDEIRKHRKALIKDINSKIALLDQKVTSEAPKEKDKTPIKEKTPEPPSDSSNQKPVDSSTSSTDSNKKEEVKGTDVSSSNSKDDKSSVPSENKDSGSNDKPAPPIPLPDK